MLKASFLRAADEEPKKTRWELQEQEDDGWLGRAWERSRQEPWIEYVPISALLPLREYHWGEWWNRHGRDEFLDLVEDMRRHGVREPITIRYFKDTNTALIIEGNHRVAAAEEAGLKEVPARVTIASYPRKDYGKDYGAEDGGPVPGLKNPNERIYADYIKPSDIGLPGHK